VSAGRRSTRAYIAGVGVNAIFPARAGDVVRLTMAHRAVKEATYTTLVSSSLVLAIVDSACAIALFIWAVTQDVFPSIDALPSLPSFDFAWFLDHPQVSQIALVIGVFGLIALAIWIRSNVEEFRSHVGQAFTILRTPARWVRTVVVWQPRGLDATPDHDLVHARCVRDRSIGPQRAARPGVAEPRDARAVSPGGVGTEQAFLVYTLRGQAPRSALLAFSVGMRLTLTAVNIVLGFTAILLTFRTIRFRKATAGADQASQYGLRRSRGQPVRWSWPNTDRAVFAGSPGTASSCSCDAARKRSAEPKCCRIARRRAGPMPSRVSKIDSNARVSRFCR
jgi:hypothetical protein